MEVLEPEVIFYSDRTFLWDLANGVSRVIWVGICGDQSQNQKLFVNISFLQNTKYWIKPDQEVILGGGTFIQIGADYDFNDKNNVSLSLRTPIHAFGNKTN